MRKKFCLLTLALMMVFAAVVAVQAQELDFGINSYGQGSIIFNGTTLTGTNIHVLDVTGFDTLGNAFPAAGSTLTISGGVLNFSANYQSFDPVSKQYVFSLSGGALTIQGNIGLGSGNETLLSLTSYVGPGNPIVYVGPAGRGGTVAMNFNDTKAQDLVEYYGEAWSPAAINTGSLNLSFLGAIDFTTATPFTSNRVLSGDVYNVLNASGAPIPGSLLLLGSGLVGLAGIGLRRKS